MSPQRTPSPRFTLSLSLALGMAATAPLAAQPVCPAEINAGVPTAWNQYRARAYAAADSLFGLVLDQCPGHVGATVGRGYVQLQQQRFEPALTIFQGLLASYPDHVDALVGAGLTHWRRDEHAASIRRFQHVLTLEPDHGLATQYVGRLAEVGQWIRRPVEKTDPLHYPSRVHGTHFDLLRQGTWEPFYVKGINLGAALPGKHASEFPDSLTYATWLEQMGAIGFNTIRIYTIHPPHFYRALREYNLRHPEQPLYVMHGVWTELPPGGDYNNPQWYAHFVREMQRVVDLLHGGVDVGLGADLRQPLYDADVSRWVMSYVIGREWEPSSFTAFEAQNPGLTAWTGRFYAVQDAGASEVFLARAMEEMTAYELDTYGQQRPMAFTSWPTLDPLTHTAEATRNEQYEIRRAFGNYVGVPERLAENDDEHNLDASRIRPSPDMPAGVFAVFHAYPYYPDFMINDPAHQGVRGPEGPSNYFAYLRRLRERLPNIPIVIAEYGVPASVSNSHIQPQGWHHGGHTEARMAEIDTRLTREIAAAGMAGSAVFAWIDEWFKKNWMVIDFEIPLERNRLWWNRLDPEQHYGMYAMEPTPRLGDGPLSRRLDTWNTIPALYLDRWGTLRATADEAYLHLFFESATGSLPEQLYIGFDTVNPDGGDHLWPGGVGDTLSVGLEFVLSITPDTVRLLADQYANPTQVVSLKWELGDSSRFIVRDITRDRPPGFFTGRLWQRFPDSVNSVPHADGVYETLRVIANDSRIGRDTVEYAGMGYDRGILRRGQLPDGLWETAPNRGIVEVRIPWTLLNVTDPSQRRVLQGPVAHARGPFGTVTVDGFGIVALARQGDRWRSWPVATERTRVARFTWDTWNAEDIQWRSRKRPVADALERTFRRLATPATEGHHRE